MQENMAVFVSNELVEQNQAFGKVINDFRSAFIDAELKRRGLGGFRAALIQVFQDGNTQIMLDEQVRAIFEFKKEMLNAKDQGKDVRIDLKDVKDVKWEENGLDKKSAKILIIRFNESYWIYAADIKRNKELSQRFRVTKTHKLRGGGYLPLRLRRQEKQNFYQKWKRGLDNELPNFWRRYVTVSQRYTGRMVYDGNYFDLFKHAQDLYVLGHYYETVILCRVAAEQTLVRILNKVGKGFDIYKKNNRLKSLEDLIEACRSRVIFAKKFPLSKVSAKKLTQISTIASDLVHVKFELDEEDAYKEKALKSMDNLNSVISQHLNFIKDTKVTSGYKFSGYVKRLK